MPSKNAAGKHALLELLEQTKNAKEANTRRANNLKIMPIPEVPAPPCGAGTREAFLEHHGALIDNSSGIAALLAGRQHDLEREIEVMDSNGNGNGDSAFFSWSKTKSGTYVRASGAIAVVALALVAVVWITHSVAAKQNEAFRSEMFTELSNTTVRITGGR